MFYFKITTHNFQKFKVLQTPYHFSNQNQHQVNVEFVSEQLTEWLERTAKIRQSINREELLRAIFALTKLMRRERWTELLTEIHSAMQICPHEILSELLTYHHGGQNVPPMHQQQQTLLLSAINISDLEAKWDEHIRAGRNLRNTAEWNAALDELVPKELFDLITMPFVLCKTLNPKSPHWLEIGNTQQTQSIYKKELFATIQAFLREMLNAKAPIYDAWCLARASLHSISTLNNLVELMRQRIQLGITMDELLIAYDRSVFKFIAHNRRAWLLRMFFENVPSTIR